EFILVIIDDDEESVKATNFNSEKETTAVAKKKNADINILRKLIDDRESVKTTNYNNVNEVTADSVREKNMNEEKNKRNFTNSEHSTDIKNERKKRILADLEIERLLNKLNLIDPSLAY
ncbi:31446_t:CDS:2, partial [Gigaspora margarita]